MVITRPRNLMVKMLPPTLSELEAVAWIELLINPTITTYDFVDGHEVRCPNLLARERNHKW